MKRFVCLFVAFLLLLSATGCTMETRQDKVVNSLGQYESKQVWTHGEFQDYTDFGLYSYSSAKIVDNPYFKAVSETDIALIYEFVDNFEKWIESFCKNNPSDELVVNYAFDRSVIDTGDYFYIYEKENYSRFSCYDIWIFDIQTNILYYFHHNI